MIIQQRVFRRNKWLLVAGFVWVLLLAGSPAYAQDPNTADLQNTDDLSGVIARLMPLLVGAALIERTIEYLFNWAEQALLDVSHWLHGFFTRVTGLLAVDAREAWQRVNELTNALVRREQLTDDPSAGDELSNHPVEWPLAKLEAQLIQARKTLAAAEKAIQQALDSPGYVSKKKTAAANLSVIFGVLLALMVGLRLFEPLGVSVAESFQDTFKYIDMVLAGILMGLGTDWVHQFISLIVKGKGFLGRAAGGNVEAIPDPAVIRQYADAYVKAEIDARMEALQEEAEAMINDMMSSDGDGNGETDRPPG